MSDLKKLQEIVLNFRDERDWKQYHSAKDSIIGLFCEVAELAEHVKFQNEQQWKEYLIDNKTDISDELSDIFYWVLLIAKDCDIDLQESLIKKIKKNEIKYPLKKATPQ